MPDPESRPPLLAVIVSCLILLTLFIFAPTFTHEFTLFDDPDYVTSNEMVTAGLTWRGAVWAFTTSFTGNWHPLTWLSHMATVELFGLNPAGHHLVNVLLHQANTLLLFVVLRAMTGTVWRSAAVAVLFGVHPLHVESVAWVSERKDVLSTLFWILTMTAYLEYIRRPNAGRYALVTVAFVLGLLSKPMVVTLPVVLLLLDYWPLGRFTLRTPATTTRRLVVEKLPWFVLAAGSSAVTVVVQSIGGNVAEMGKLSVADRLMNALLSYTVYLKKTVWPSDLAAFYPHPATLPGGFPFSRAIVACLVLAAMSAAVFALRGRRYLVVGWLWFLVTFLPAIGLVQVGQQGMADRYTYVPLIGIFLMIAWGLGDLVEGRPGLRRASVIIGIAAVVVLAGVARSQSRYWHDTVTLFERALRVTPQNRVAHLQLGAAHARLGNLEQAASHYSAALTLKPDSVEALNNLGIVQAQAGRPTEAATTFARALQIVPNDARLHANLARALRAQGAVRDAVTHYREAVRLAPRAWDVAATLAWILATEEDDAVRNAPEARSLAEHAVRLTNRSQPRPLEALAAAYAELGRYSDAEATAQEALRAAIATGQTQLARGISERMARYRAVPPNHVDRSAAP
jgi:Flp pilus assembly protein TadD